DPRFIDAEEFISLQSMLVSPTDRFMKQQDTGGTPRIQFIVTGFEYPKPVRVFNTQDRGNRNPVDPEKCDPEDTPARRSGGIPGKKLPQIVSRSHCRAPSSLPARCFDKECLLQERF